MPVAALACRSYAGRSPTAGDFTIRVVGERNGFVLATRRVAQPLAPWLSATANMTIIQIRRLTMGFLGTLGAIHRVGWRMTARIPFGASHYCCICESRVRRFLPYRRGMVSVPPLMLQLAVVGSDVEHFECPVCQSHDRERHLLMYLNTSNLLRRMGGTRILHFAPERHLQRFIRTAEPAEYVLGDLYPASAGVQKIDLQAVPYSDDYFDFVLANHVLEHVQDDAQALREIFRVLRPGGHAILQTPYASGLTKTFEDSAIRSEQACLQAYGQEDHRRLYGQDIAHRFEASGLRSLMKTHSQLLPDVDHVRFGVNPQEPFLLLQKNHDLC